MNKYSFHHTITPRLNTNDQLLIEVLDNLLSRYLDRVPDAQRIVKLFQDRGDKIINDHIAFRSIHIESILKIFIHLGYDVRMDSSTNKPFNFESKKLTAVWLKHPNKNVPRIFVSQFRFNEGSSKLKSIISNYLDQWEDPIEKLDLNDPMAINEYLHTAQWPTPTYNDYCDIQKESEYVSWVLYNKYYLNHFTLSVHELDSFKFIQELEIVLKNYQQSYKKHPSAEVLDDGVKMMKRKYKKQFFEFNEFLKDNNFNMNNVGENGLNIAPDECLLQSSTKSNQIDAEFNEGTYKIPGSYVEFAYRGFVDDVIKDAIRNNKNIKELNNSLRRDGFETKNADKIFESTYIGKEEMTEKKTSAYELSCEQINNFLNKIKPTH